jgi:hypothetical protein
MAPKGTTLFMAEAELALAHRAASGTSEVTEFGADEATRKWPFPRRRYGLLFVSVVAGSTALFAAAMLLILHVLGR